MTVRKRFADAFLAPFFWAAPLEAQQPIVLATISLYLEFQTQHRLQGLDLCLITPNSPLGCSVPFPPLSHDIRLREQRDGTILLKAVPASLHARPFKMETH